VKRSLNILPLPGVTSPPVQKHLISLAIREKKRANDENRNHL